MCQVSFTTDDSETDAVISEVKWMHSGFLYAAIPNAHPAPSCFIEMLTSHALGRNPKG